MGIPVYPNASNTASMTIEMKSRHETNQSIEEIVLRGYGSAYCENEQKKANLYYINNAAWDVICEFCGKIGEGTWDDNHKYL